MSNRNPPLAARPAPKGNKKTAALRGPSLAGRRRRGPEGGTRRLLRRRKSEAEGEPPRRAKKKPKKKPASRRVFRRPATRRALLDLAFLVFHVLTDDGVILHEHHLFRRVLLVLRGRVEVTGARGGNQAVLIALACHGSISLDLFAAGTEVGQHGFDTVLVDGAQRVVGNAQLHPAVLAGDPEATLVQVRQPAATGLVVRVRDVVAALHTLIGDLASTGHGGLL